MGGWLEADSMLSMEAVSTGEAIIYVAVIAMVCFIAWLLLR